MAPCQWPASPRVGRVEAASLDWLEQRGLARADLRDMLVAALDRAVSAAAGTDSRMPAAL